MNPIVEIDGAHSSVWLIVIDDKIWGYVPSNDSVKSAFKFLADKFIEDIKTANPNWKVEAVQLTEEKMQIKCIQVGYVFNSEWIAHTMIASPIKEYREPNDNQTPILMPFPEKSDEGQDTVEEVPSEVSVAPLPVPIEEVSSESSVIVTPEQIEAKIVELVPRESPKNKRKKRSRVNTPEASVEQMITSASQQVVVPAVETAPSIIQLDQPTHIDAPKNLKSSWERKKPIHMISHINRYPINRSNGKKK